MVLRDSKLLYCGGPDDPKLAVLVSRSIKTQKSVTHLRSTFGTL